MFNQLHRLRLLALSATLFVLTSASGCASHARVAQDAEGRGDKNAASQLYAGQPAVVHATEYPVFSAAEGIARGDEAWSQGKLDLAVYLYVQSLAFDATTAMPFLKIGAIHERQGNRGLAEKAFELALERDPDNAAANERLGLLYLQSQKNEATRALFEHAITIDPDRWQSHNGLGVVADRRGDFASAIAHYDAALEFEPRAMTVMNNRGYSRFLAGDFAGAEADFRTAIQTGAQPGTWTNLARAQARQGKYGEALESFLKECNAAQAHNRLGEAAMENGDLEAARSYFELAISASPRHFHAAHDNLALVNARQGQFPPRATRIARMDASVFGTQARSAVIAVMRRGVPVSVLKTENASSLVRFRDVSGVTLTGWVSSNSLADSGS